MKTITFYSYKGGTGRSLAVANAALYLCRLGFRVAVIDFDLEAPGLHYKFALSPKTRIEPKAGIADYILARSKGDKSNDISEYALAIETPFTDGKIYLIPAGAAPSASYWSVVASLDWHAIFYSPNAVGISLFSEMKTAIQDSIKPDFLLVDSRTGITEMSGLATSIICDSMISLITPTPENMEGVREVLRSVCRTRRRFDLPSIEIQVAISRLANDGGHEREAELANAVLLFFNENADKLEDTLSLPEIKILHHDALLAAQERLLVRDQISPDDSPLLRDYLKLFVHMVPSRIVEGRLSALMAAARDRMFSDPDGAVTELEQLADSFGHPETYRELLRFYNVRNRFEKKGVNVAERLWELNQELSGAASRNVVFRALAADSEVSPKIQINPRFLVDLWMSAKGSVPDGLRVASWLRARKSALALEVLIDLANRTDLEVDEIVGLAEAFKQSQSADNARELFVRHIEQFSGNQMFVRAMLDVTLQTSDPSLVNLISRWIPEEMLASNPLKYAELLGIMGEDERARRVASEQLRRVGLERLPPSELRDLGMQFDRIGMAFEFAEALRRAVGDTEFDKYRRFLPSVVRRPARP